MLAQKVLTGGTRGYTRHPQLERFRGQHQPLQVMAALPTCIAEEAQQREYSFDVSKIAPQPFAGQLEETNGQLLYEWKHLRSRLQLCAPHLYRKFRSITTPEPHPLFRIVPGCIRQWEKR